MRQRPFAFALVAIVALGVFGLAEDSAADEISGPGLDSARQSSPRVGVGTAALRQQIQRDQARLEELVSTPPSPGEPPLHEQPELREIAGRLPRLQAELRVATGNVEPWVPSIGPRASEPTPPGPTSP